MIQRAAKTKLNQSVNQTDSTMLRHRPSITDETKEAGKKEDVQFSTMYVKDFRLLCHTFQQKRFNSFINTV